MPQLSFTAEFADLVADGKKCQTIRPPRKDGRDPKPGDTLYLKSGPYSGKRRNLGVVKCTSVNRVTIGPGGIGFEGPSFIEPLVRTQIGADIAAKEDGFENFAAMREWFEKNGGLPFEGYLIKWNPAAKPATGDGRGATMTVIEIVESYLKSNGFNGLYYLESDRCACLLNDLAPCGEITADCQAGYKTPGCVLGCSIGGCDFHVGPKKPEATGEGA